MYNSNVVAPPVMNHEFKVQGGWIRGYLLAFFMVLPLSVFLFNIQSRDCLQATTGVKKNTKKTAYTCSDIVAIECNYHSGLKTSYYYIELVFRDQTKFQVEKHLGNFKVFAIYLLQMLDAGVISEYAVHPLHRERLHMYAQGKVFRR